jgi:hypothetical protein
MSLEAFNTDYSTLSDIFSVRKNEKRLSVTLRTQILKLGGLLDSLLCYCERLQYLDDKLGSFVGYELCHFAILNLLRLCESMSLLCTPSTVLCSVHFQVVPHHACSLLWRVGRSTAICHF